MQWPGRDSRPSEAPHADHRIGCNDADAFGIRQRRRVFPDADSARGGGRHHLGFHPALAQRTIERLMRNQSRCVQKPRYASQRGPRSGNPAQNSTGYSDSGFALIAVSRPLVRPPERAHAQIKKHHHHPGGHQKRAMVWPMQRLARARHRFGANATTGSRKKTRSLQAKARRPRGQTAAETRPRRGRPRGQPDPPPARPPARHAPGCTAGCCRGRCGSALALAAICSPAMRPATRNPVPRIRPIRCGFISSIMVAATIGEQLFTASLRFAIAPGRSRK